LYLFYKNNTNANISSIKQNEKTQITIQSQIINNSIKNIGSDLLYLSELSSLKDYIENKNNFSKSCIMARDMQYYHYNNSTKRFFTNRTFSVHVP